MTATTTATATVARQNNKQARKSKQYCNCCCLYKKSIVNWWQNSVVGESNCEESETKPNKKNLKFLAKRHKKKLKRKIEKQNF